jgi:hypothetical protein
MKKKEYQISLSYIIHSFLLPLFCLFYTLIFFSICVFVCVFRRREGGEVGRVLDQFCSLKKNTRLLYYSYKYMTTTTTTTTTKRNLI